MKTKIHYGKYQYSGEYWQGLMLITQGRLKDTWREVTKKCSSEEEAEQELNDFKASAKDE